MFTVSGSHYTLTVNNLQPVCHIAGHVGGELKSLENKEIEKKTGGNLL